MGGVTARDARRGRVVRRDDPHRGRGRARSRSPTAARPASCSRTATSSTPTRSSRPRTRRSRSSSTSSARSCPTTSSTAIERWKTRSGTVKVNLALDRLPEFTREARLRPRGPRRHDRPRAIRSTTSRARSRTRSPAAPRALPFADICIPSVFDPTLAPPGKHVMSMFTQWVPHALRRRAARRRARGLRRPADRADGGSSRPGFTSARSCTARSSARTRWRRRTACVGGNIFHGELSANQLFHMRPAPGYADFTTPIRGLYQASSATHGGGGVTGIPALQVVRKLKGLS